MTSGCGLRGSLKSLPAGAGAQGLSRLASALGVAEIGP